MYRKFRLTELTALVVIALLLPAIATAADPSREFVVGEMVCQIKPSYTIDSINSQYGTTYGEYLPGIAAYLLYAPPGQNAESLAAVISASADVYYCSANYYLDSPEAVQSSQPFLDAVPSLDPLAQPAATTLRLPQVRAAVTGAGVKVGILDVGIDLSNKVLAPKTSSGFDYISGDQFANDEPGGIASGHGTFVAGIVNLVAPDAELVAYRVLDTNGRGNGFSIAEALVRAVDHGCKVVNLSIVMSGKHDVLDAAIEYARLHDVTVIAAAGNDSSEVERFPASNQSVLSVASLDSSGHRSDFSNYNGKISLCAPGEEIYAPFLDSAYAWWNGTSFAAPFVTGTAALVYAIRPNASWDEARDALLQTATNVDSLNPMFTGKLGMGLINPLAVVQVVQGSCCVGLRGNIDGLGGVDLSDLARLIAFLTDRATPLECSEEANVDGHGTVDLSDLTTMIAYLVGMDVTLAPCSAD